MSGSVASGEPARAGHVADPISCATCRHQSGVGFAGLDRNGAEALAALRRGRGFARGGEILALEDDLAALTIYSGIVLQLHAWPSGGEQPVRLGWPGETFACTAGARLRLRAVTDVSYCRFPADGWSGLLQNPVLAERLALVLADRLEELTQFAASTASLSAAGRVCRVLGDAYLQLSRRRVISNTSFELPLERRDLAALVGLTPTHLRRTLRHLENEAVLGFTRSRVTLIDVDRVLTAGRLSAGPTEPRPLL